VNQALTAQGIFDAPDNAGVLCVHWESLEDSIPAGRRSVIVAQSMLAMPSNAKAFLPGIRPAATFTVLLVSANSMAMPVRERSYDTTASCGHVTRSSTV